MNESKMIPEHCLMTSKKSYKEIEKETTRGRKRYLERVQQTQEAEEEIKEFTPEQLEFDFPEPDGE